MKRRAFQVTRVTKKIDGRLQRLEKQLQRIDKLLTSLERQLKTEQESSTSHTTTATITYNLSSKE